MGLWARICDTSVDNRLVTDDADREEEDVDIGGEPRKDELTDGLVLTVENGLLLCWLES